MVFFKGDGSSDKKMEVFREVLRLVSLLEEELKRCRLPAEIQIVTADISLLEAMLDGCADEATERRPDRCEAGQG